MSHLYVRYITAAWSSSSLWWQEKRTSGATGKHWCVAFFHRGRGGELLCHLRRFPRLFFTCMCFAHAGEYSVYTPVYIYLCLYLCGHPYPRSPNSLPYLCIFNLSISDLSVSNLSSAHLSICLQSGYLSLVYLSIYPSLTCQSIRAYIRLAHRSCSFAGCQEKLLRVHPLDRRFSFLYLNANTSEEVLWIRTKEPIWFLQWITWKPSFRIWFLRLTIWDVFSHALLCLYVCLLPVGLKRWLKCLREWSEDSEDIFFFSVCMRTWLALEDIQHIHRNSVGCISRVESWCTYTCWLIAWEFLLGGCGSTRGGGASSSISDGRWTRSSRTRRSRSRTCRVTRTSIGIACGKWE